MANNPGKHSISSIFLKGLAAMIPLIVTLWAVAWLVGPAERLLGRAIVLVLPEAWYLPGMGLFLGLVLIFIVGLLLNALIARQLLGFIEGIFHRVPLIKSLYGSVKDLSSFFMSGQERRASQVVMVTLGQVRVLGLLTRERFDDLPPGIGDADTVAVYIPMSYQLGGFTLMLPRSSVTPVPMSTEEALRFAITAGMGARSQEVRG